MSNKPLTLHDRNMSKSRLYTNIKFLPGQLKLFQGTNTTYCENNAKVQEHCAGIICVWNVMAHAQKPEFVFRRNGRVHLNRRGRQFSRLLTAEVCASAVVMLDKPRSEGVWEYWLPTPFASFPFTSPPLCHQVPNELYHCFSGKEVLRILNLCLLT